MTLRFSRLILVATLAVVDVANALSTFGGVGKQSPKIGRVQAGPIEISSMGCGTWSWGNRLLYNYDPSQDEDLYEAYRAVRTAGVSIFDTADSYGTLDLNGRAEILLGRFERRLRTELANGDGDDDGDDGFLSFLSPLRPTTTTTTPPPQQVATKFAPYPWRVFRGDMVRAAEASLARLEQPKLALAQLHWSTSKYQPFQERALWEGIADVHDAGLCEAVGVSNYGPKQLARFADFLRDERPGVPLATAQVQYSLMTARDCEDLKERCDDVGARMISYSPLCLGLLTCKYDENRLPPVGNPRRRLFQELLPGARPLLGTLAAVARDVDRTPSQVAINWTMRKGGVPIPGARTLAQAQENLGATGWSLSNGAMDELDRAARAVSKPMIQNIFQTE